MCIYIYVYAYIYIYNIHIYMYKCICFGPLWFRRPVEWPSQKLQVVIAKEVHKDRITGEENRQPQAARITETNHITRWEKW